MSIFVSFPFVDAFHTGKNDEHSIFHVPKYREYGALGTKEEPSTATQEHLSLCTDQDHSDASVGTTGYSMGGFHFSRLLHGATPTS